MTASVGNVLKITINGRTSARKILLIKDSAAVAAASANDTANAISVRRKVLKNADQKTPLIRFSPKLLNVSDTDGIT